MSIFVTDGDQRSTLAVTRALGRAGVSVAVGESSLPSLAGSSRYCAKSVKYPSPMTLPEEFLAYVQTEVRTEAHRVVLPMTDITTALLTKAAPMLAPARVPVASFDCVRLANDKRDLILLAARLGIPCPQTWMLHEGEQLEDVARQVRYPVVIKPRYSRFCRNGKWISGPVVYAKDATELIDEYRKSDADIPGPLVQEMIHGEGRGVFLLVWNGELKGAFAHRRLREKPPSGGVSVLRESIPLDERLVEQSFSLLKAIGWEGVAMVEYKLDQRHDVPRLMEVNPRFWGSLQLAIDSGMNFPLQLYRLAINEEIASAFDYQVGVKSRWLLGDLDNLLIQFKHPHNGHGEPGKSRLQACVDFCKFREKDMHYEVFKLDDPRPGLLECKHYVRDLFRQRPKPKEESSAR